MDSYLHNIQFWFLLHFFHCRKFKNIIIGRLVWNLNKVSMDSYIHTYLLICYSSCLDSLKPMIRMLMSLILISIMLLMHLTKFRFCVGIIQPKRCKWRDLLHWWQNFLKEWRFLWSGNTDCWGFSWCCNSKRSGEPGNWASVRFDQASPYWLLYICRYF